MSTATLVGERVGRLVVRLRHGLGAAFERAREAAEPWLRREAWTAESLKDLVASARRRPRLLAAMGIGVLALLLALGMLHSVGPPPGLATAVASEGPFRVAIVETGRFRRCAP